MKDNNKQSKWRRNLPILIFFLIWVIFMITFTDFFSNLRIPTGAWITATHEQYNFAIQFPDRWSVHKYGERGYHSSQEIKLGISNGLRGFNGIHVKIIEVENPTLEDAANWGDEWLQGISPNGQYTERSFTEDTVNGYPALRRVSVVDERLFEDVYIAREHDFVVITLQTSRSYYATFAQDFDRIVHSFTTLE